MSMFYEAYNGLRGLHYCIFLLSKSVIIGIVLTNDQGVIVGPLTKVWIIAGLYIADAVHQIFYSPDQDAINGLKIGVQQALQAVIMFIAALTTSGAISEDRGIDVCIKLSLVQVSLAIPEQLWGTVSNVTKKKGNPDEYEFKMTEKQINAVKAQAPSMLKRSTMAKQLFAESRKLKPLVLEKDRKSLLKKLLSHPETITNMDSLFPYFIPAFFSEHLFSPEVKSFLSGQKKAHEMNNLTESAKIIGEVLDNEWEDCLDLRAGMDSLMRLKTTMNTQPDGHLAATRGVSPVNVKRVDDPGQGLQVETKKQSPSEPVEGECSKDYDMFLDQLLTKAISQEGFVEAFDSVLPEPVQMTIDKLQGKSEDSDETADPPTKWNTTEKIMLCFMGVMGLLTMSILTAMGMSTDCGCVCGSGETPKYIWGVSFGLVSALTISLVAVGMTAFYVLRQWGTPEAPIASRPPPVCDSIFLSTDKKDLHGLEGDSSIAEPKSDAAISSVQDSCLEKLSRGEDSVTPVVKVSTSQDLEFKPFGPPIFPGSSDWQQLGSGDSWPPPFEMPPDNYLQFYSPADYYNPQQSSGSD
eukprot:CAMPEP_0172155328 /NCGR_PEP_ID=MMETSP1050-20130122/2564_1 /TAXON_ID=233186 /ORGANISM="Cryptomonas curvata, Strain CCAP979/52" /LENGTH=578 /DNA_ID=CAMNT_0012824213 /DNA_START=76 /DNA_END=1812 /DNA_ORIENTATION=-